MARAYKCDICGKYCDDVFSMSGIAQPKTHYVYSNLKDTSIECCEDCYDKIMVKVEEMIKQKAGDGL